MERELAGIQAQYEFLAAVDGRTIDLADHALIDQEAVRSSAFALGAGTPGAIGCALSHLRAYEMIANGVEDFALVLEDDVSLPDDLLQLDEAVAAHMSGSELTLLNFHSERREWVLAEPPVPMPGGRHLVTPTDMITRILHSSAAYVITKEASERLASAILPARVAADSWGTFLDGGATGSSALRNPEAGLSVAFSLHY